MSSIRYKAWHSWAYMNFEAVLFYKHQGQNTSANQTLIGENTNKGLVNKKICWNSFLLPMIKFIYSDRSTCIILHCTCRARIFPLDCIVTWKFTSRHSSPFDIVVWLRALAWSVWSSGRRCKNNWCQYVVTSDSSVDSQNWYATSASWQTYSPTFDGYRKGSSSSIYHFPFSLHCIIV